MKRFNKYDMMGYRSPYNIFFSRGKFNNDLRFWL